MSPRLSISPDDALLHGKSDTGVWDGTKFTKVRRGRPEAAIQTAIKRRLTLYGCLCVAVPNEGRRSAALGRAMKQTGLLPGMPDLLVMQRPGRIAFLEVKAEKGRVSPAQAEAHETLRRLGHHIAVVRSQDDAVEALRGWGFAV